MTADGEDARGDVTPLFQAPVLDRLRAAAEASFTIGDVHGEIGLAGQAALNRADLDGVERALSDSPTAGLIRLFLLGLPVDRRAAAAALRPLPVDRAISAGLLVGDADQVRAQVDFRPYAEAGGDGWWVLADQSVDVRRGELAADHVLGIGAAATTLAQAVMREQVGAAADIGTGCGVQALHLSRHAERVIATDVSLRALRMAAANARLNDLTWDLRRGSLLEPLAGRRVDLLVCNPPFIVGPGFAPGADGFSYRDSGLTGDEVSRRLVQAASSALREGGAAQLLANWILTGTQPWQERVGGWLAGSGCDAWIWQREVLEPGEYVCQWLRDAGDRPGSPDWRRRYRRWTDWFASAGVAAVGLGLVSVRRTGSADPVVVCEDLRQVVEQPVGPWIAGWFERARWLRQRSDRELVASRLRLADGVSLDTRSWRAESGWQTGQMMLTQTCGLRWQVEADEAVAALMAGCDGSVPLGVVLAILGVEAHGGAERSDPAGSGGAEVAVVIRDLVQRGFLLPAS